MIRPICATPVGLFFVLICAASAVASPGQSFEAAKNHWSYQPLRIPALPKVKAEGRVQSPIDAFLLTALERKGLTFTPTADKKIGRAHV